MEKTVPVFVKIDNYHDVLDILDVMKKKVKETKATMQKIRELKTLEDSELAEWEKNVNEIARRLAYVDAAFFDSEM